MEQLKDFGAWILALAIAVVGFFVRREIKRSDEHDDRLRELETDRVTRDHVDELRHSLTATIANAQERTEERFDRLFMMLSKRDER